MKELGASHEHVTRLDTRIKTLMNEIKEVGGELEEEAAAAAAAAEAAKAQARAQPRA